MHFCSAPKITPHRPGWRSGAGPWCEPPVLPHFRCWGIASSCQRGCGAIHHPYITRQQHGKSAAAPVLGWRLAGRIDGRWDGGYKHFPGAPSASLARNQLPTWPRATSAPAKASPHLHPSAPAAEASGMLSPHAPRQPSAEPEGRQQDEAPRSGTLQPDSTGASGWRLRAGGGRSRIRPIPEELHPGPAGLWCVSRAVSAALLRGTTTLSSGSTQPGWWHGSLPTCTA